MNELPSALAAEVEKYTNTPWWNGEAYAECVGYPQKISCIQNDICLAMDQLRVVMDELRSAKMYDLSDRVRTAMTLITRESTELGY